MFNKDRLDKLDARLEAMAERLETVGRRVDKLDSSQARLHERLEDATAGGLVSGSEHATLAWLLDHLTVDEIREFLDAALASSPQGGRPDRIVVLAALPPRRRDLLIGELVESRREQLMLDACDSDGVDSLDQDLVDRMTDIVRQKLAIDGRARVLSHIILMTHPPQQWPAVTAALRATHTGRGRAVVDATSAYLFGQESFSYMDQEGIRHFLRDCDREYLLTMLNRLDPVTRGNVFACMARRAALMTYEDLDLMAPPTFADREEARRVIGDIVRALIEDGKVILRDDVDRLLDEFDELLRDDGEGP